METTRERIFHSYCGLIMVSLFLSGVFIVCCCFHLPLRLLVYVSLFSIMLAAVFKKVGGAFFVALLSSLCAILYVRVAEGKLSSESIEKLLLLTGVYLIEGMGVGWLVDLHMVNREKFRSLSRLDELTGVLNFSTLMTILEEEFKKAEEGGNSLVVVMVDIDNIREVIGNYGDAVSEMVLKEFSEVAKEVVGKRGVIGRYGGDEFLIFFSGKDVRYAERVIDKVRIKLSAVSLPVIKDGKSTSLGIRFSAGVAAFPSNGGGLKEIIYSAEEALRVAKSEGKNRTVVERRRWARVSPPESLRIEIYVPSSGKVLEAIRIINISRNGMLLVFPEDLPFENLVLRLYLPQVSTVECKCQIMHKKQSGDGTYQIGVFVENMPEYIQKRIVKFE